ncbi:hypothetical protein [Aquibacillus rhizosphaerae]|uniref:Lipoprotein n=1 Tax=Aquibacillus rhizosphaerae TaxID=3051431 RepID=A0ABT7L8I6_9BACI|nr:hypothetical protein [Aquibacillus sp. LR5S19]MDL4842174.1 hypothetical protein [Aquibacillus sp. LR5S19]
MKWIGSFVLIIFFLVACSEESPTITKIDSSENNINQKPALIENELEENNDEEKELLLEFKLPNEIVTINLERVGILKNYLDGVENSQIEINNMNLLPLEIPNETLYLLEFSCQNNTCSYLLLDQGNDDGRSLLIADLAKYQQLIPSPDNDKLLFVFSRNSDLADYEKNRTIIIDMNEFISIHITNPNDKRFFEYQWPFEHITWKDNTTVTITIPEVLEPDSSLLNAWLQSERETKTHTIKLD